jgi:arsenate reductase
MAKTVEVYGIKSCDTMKKARAWLDAKGVTYTFHDYKTEGVDLATLTGWEKRLGWETVLNRAGTTFRALPDNLKENLGPAKAVNLMMKYPSLIKRPMLVTDRELIAGFKPDIYAAAFK